MSHKQPRMTLVEKIATAQRQAEEFAARTVEARSQVEALKKQLATRNAWRNGGNQE